MEWLDALLYLVRDLLSQVGVDVEIDVSAACSGSWSSVSASTGATR